MKITKKEIKLMKDKSISSFLMCLEVFNKPTIDYRLEGCIFFLCNAWELLLKAKLASNGESIHYKKKRKEKKQSLSLMDSASRLMTNDKDPIRINLTIINSLRNSATHYIIPEYEITYMPYLTFCVKAYADKLYEYFGIDINDYIKTEFLSLFTTNKTVDHTRIISKYGKNILESFQQKENELVHISNNSDSAISMKVDVTVVRVNNKSNADYSFYMSKNPSDQHVISIEKPINYELTHPLRYYDVVNEIDKTIKKNNIQFSPIRTPISTPTNNNPKIFTSACFDLIRNEYNIINDLQYCHSTKNGKQTIYKYSASLITFVIQLIQDDPNIVLKLNMKNKKKNS